MLFSLALMIFSGFLLGGMFQKLRLPALLGMILAGILLGPSVFNLIDSSILSVSAELRQIALIVILIRAGLALNAKQLKQVGRPAVLMCFVPASFELIAVTFLAPMLFHISHLEAAILGAVLAAVSPAVVVPRMLRLMEEGYGTKQSVPQLIMAGASMDDIYVIVLLYSFLGLWQGGSITVSQVFSIPVSMILGILLGIAGGLLTLFLFRKIPMRTTIKVLLLLGVSFCFVTLETALKPYFAVSGLLAVMALGMTILTKNAALAKDLSAKYSKIWVFAELILFVLVGAAVDIHSVKNAGLSAVLLVFGALIFRMLGVFVCVAKTNLTKKERIFIAISYLPKATVQAATCGIPLAVGVPSGNLIVTIAVFAILITAPLGAIGTDRSYPHLLSKNES